MEAKADSEENILKSFCMKTDRSFCYSGILSKIIRNFIQ